ncbi:MAG: hypothetical protein U1E36_09865 [Rickettsiales bacterium]
MHQSNYTSKVPQVTLAFWLIKIAATTLGETGGDALSMSLNLGYAVSTAIFFIFFIVTLTGQIRTERYNPFLYWAVIIATTTVGTTLADFIDRSLGVGYAGGIIILSTLLLLVIAAWRWRCGSVSVKKIKTRSSEIFYWVTILFSNTLGTALGDWLADDPHFGYVGGAIVFLSILAVITILYFLTHLSRTLLFWAAFIITRPLGATLGDFLTKPLDHGGLDLSRFTSTTVLAVFILIGVFLGSYTFNKSKS